MSLPFCSEFLKRIKDSDQDIRGMAVSDLLNNLKTEGIQLSKDDGQMCSEALILSLTDLQSYVQNLAMECLGQLVSLIDTNTVLAVVISICNRITDAGKNAGNSALSVALRVIVTRVAENAEEKTVLAHMATPVVNTLENSAQLPTDVIVDIFGALSEVLTHAGAHLAADESAVAAVQTLLLKYISHSSIPVRRRAIEALGRFVVSVPGERSDQALDNIFKRYTASANTSDGGILLRVLVTIIRQRPSRVESLVSVIIKLELKNAVVDDRERRVASLVAFEAIVRNCPSIAKQSRDDIYRAAVEALEFDPNYIYGEGDDDDEGEAGGNDMDTDSENDFGDDFDEDIYEDDEDDTWEIRLNGVKLLTAFIKSDMLESDDLVAKLGKALIGFFKEREDIVRAEILLAYATNLDSLKARLDTPSTVAMEVENNVPALLSEQAQSVVAALASAIKAYGKSTETKQLAFAILSRMVAIDEKILDPYLPSIGRVLTATLSAEDTAGALQSASTSLVRTNLKLDALDFLKAFITRSSLSDSATDFLLAAKDGIKRGISSKTFQAPAASLDVASGLVQLLRLSADSEGRDISQFSDWICDMASVSLSLMDSNDQSLRSSSYAFTGVVIRQFGDMLSPSVVDSALQTLTSWKQGATQNLTLINALIACVTLPTHLPRTKVLECSSTILEQAESLLHKYDQAVNGASLELIRSLAEYGNEALGSQGSVILKSIIGVISRTPASPPTLALQAFARVCPFVSEADAQAIVPGLIQVLSNAVVYESQDASALVELFELLGQSFPGLATSWSEIILDYWCHAYAKYSTDQDTNNSDVVQLQFPSAILVSAAKSLLALYTGYYRANGEQWSSEFLTTYIDTSSESSRSTGLVCLGLRALGYAATRGLLDQDQALGDKLYTLVNTAGNDDVRNEAAIALGSYSGRRPESLPALFSQATASEGAASQSLFHAVKVAIEYVVGTKRDSAIARNMWTIIAQYVLLTEKPLADIVAQTLAIFAISFPSTYIPLLSSSIGSSGGNAEAKITFITTLRTVLADKQASSECDEQIEVVLPSILVCIGDENIKVRRLTLLAMYAIVQTRPAMIRNTVSSVQSMLFEQTQINEALIRTIIMGPFKRKVDDGLDTRKCAYQCVHILARSMPEVLNGSDVADCVVRGINDDQEIRMIVSQIVSETNTSLLAASYAAKAADLSAAIEKALDEKVAPKAVKHETEKFDEMMRTTVSILVSLELVTKLPGCDANVFAKQIATATNTSNGKLNDYYKEFTEAASSGSK